MPPPLAFPLRSSRVDTRSATPPATGPDQLRQNLRELGLPHTGNKAAMVARHKRLVLLDAAAADMENPTPRAELVRKVAAWSVGFQP